jgi:hypothetical protein
MAVELAPITRGDVPRVAAFLHRHLDDAVSVDRWTRAIAVPWSDAFGFMLVDDGDVVGAQLAWRSQRTIAGREEPFCNLGSWCVLPEHRTHSLRLVRAALADRDCHYTDLTPRPEVVAINERLGFRHLDTTTLLVPNLPWRGAGNVTDDPAILERTLTGGPRQIWLDHRDAEPARHVLLRRGHAWCHVLLRLERRRGLRFASVLHVSDPVLFAAMTRALGSHLLLRHRAVAMLVEPRIAGSRPRPAFALRSTQPKMFRSSRLELAHADDLYSELVFQPW